MKKTIFLLLCPLFLMGQSIGYIEVVHERKNDPYVELSANKNGGTAIFNRTYRTGCVGSYEIRWTFSKDLALLQPGETFDVTLQCVSCRTPCGYKWGIADVMASNNVLKIPGYQEYTYNGNIGLVGKSGSSSGVFDWQPAQLSNTYTFKYQPKKSAKYTAIAFTIVGHRVYYVFGEGSSPSAGGINCHTLLGLGKLVNSLELGAYEGYPWDWMDKTIDYALNHIKASSCLSDTYLRDLKSRMYRASDTRIFYAEIQTYSQKLESEVASSCSACSSCTQ
ncbi:hypothetical protein [Allomuricauda sp. SCSIO 65647]|uniref:hypothetical protein n=1 Tax=Allomuricauda sp. SCSIO 65647 TaxID=2908843 RepID=UPI001F4464C6|nr:hypothetical protein [Muricauda sp. SCSIO 65647]UJH68419.1 hypothetical protein L0P89_04230 [Muricauda sp. SCSIO 65647]